jgi:hypothetical protein
MNYFDIYSHVSRIISRQMLIATVAIKKLEIYQLDVKQIS